MPERLAPRDRTPVLQLEATRPEFEASQLPPQPFTLNVARGEFALIETREPQRAAAFAELCLGLMPLAEGSVRFQGFDWAELGEAQAGALRGRIGRFHGHGAWGSPGRRADREILLSRLHHTRIPEGQLAQDALALSRAFGLPGIPIGPAALLSDMDLARAGCVRAFLGDPALLLLENPVTASHASLLPPLLRALTDARHRGAAIVCLTRERQIWRNYLPFVTAHLRLHDHGLGHAGPVVPVPASDPRMATA